jgi:uncharacterized membrane protein YhaH (DUF805 family)
MPWPGFSILALALLAVLAILAVGACVAVWRLRSLALSYRSGLIVAIAVMAAAGIGWIIFVSPVYVD